jgi:predicted nucleotidyltransferase
MYPAMRLLKIEMILFGSYARGDFMNESDIDLMLLLDNMNDVASEGDKYRSIISRISLNRSYYAISL